MFDIEFSDFKSDSINLGLLNTKFKTSSENKDKSNFKKRGARYQM